MKSKHICPKCGGKRFITVVHVVQSWIVNEDGDFIEAQTECDEVTYEPDDENIWTCENCGAEAILVNK